MLNIDFTNTLTVNQASFHNAGLTKFLAGKQTFQIGYTYFKLLLTSGGKLYF